VAVRTAREFDDREELRTMSLGYGASALVIERLGPADLVELFAFLDRDPVLNVYLIALTLRDALARPRDELWAARRDGAIVALVYLGGHSGAVLPHGSEPEAIERLAVQALARRDVIPRHAQVIGPRDAVGIFTRRFAAAGVAARLVRDQSYLALERGRLAPFERLPELRRAQPEDYALVYDSGARLRSEELDEDPRETDAGAYARRVEEECRDGYTHLWVDRDGLRFRASVSALTGDAAQVAGVYTPPARRRRGYARRGLAELCARLHERCASVCLFVNDFNLPAIDLYRALGFRHLADWGSAFYDRL
jgi:hypothetical protein